MKLLVTLAAGVFGWDYQSQASWGVSNEYCNGDAQSPIDITGATVKPRSDFVQTNYDQNVTWSGENNGHTIKFKPIGDDSMVPFINSPTLSGEDYKLLQFHLHWGSGAKGTGTGTEGSEHTLEGRRYFAELHLVHYNTKYTDISEALAHSDGLAVVGHFLEMIEDDPKNNAWTVDNGWSTPWDNFLGSMVGDQLKEPSDGSPNAAWVALSFDLAGLGLVNFGDYYRYKGSLTTPPCNEVVQWTVAKETLKISRKTVEQMISFTLTKQGDVMIDNYREIQPLNGREIVLYSDEESAEKEKKLDMKDLLLLSMMTGQDPNAMNSMLPFILMRDDDMSQRKKMLMLMMMQGGDMVNMNPLLMMTLLD